MDVYNLSSTYWCTLCNELHVRIRGSEESLWKTGWKTVDGVNYNIGFCNGVHRSLNAPKYLGGQNVLPAPLAVIY